MWHWFNLERPQKEKVGEMAGKWIFSKFFNVSQFKYCTIQCSYHSIIYWLTSTKKEKILSCKHCYCIQKLYRKRFLIQPGSKETRKKLFRLNIGDSPNHFLLKGNQVLFPVRWLRLKKISVNFLLFFVYGNRSLKANSFVTGWMKCSILRCA